MTCAVCNDTGWVQEDGEDQYGHPSKEMVRCQCKRAIVPVVLVAPARRPTDPPRPAFVDAEADITEPVLVTSLEHATQVCGPAMLDFLRVPLLRGAAMRGVWIIPHPDTAPIKPAKE